MNNISYKGPKGGTSLKQSQVIVTTVDGGTSLTRTIPIEVDPNKSIISDVKIIKQSGFTSSAPSAWSVKIENGTTLRLNRKSNLANTPITMIITVDEYFNVKSKQSGSYTIPTVDGTDKNITINSVDLNKTKLGYSFYTEILGTIDEAEEFCNRHMYLTTSTNLKIEAGRYASSFGWYFEYEILELP